MSWLWLFYPITLLLVGIAIYTGNRSMVYRNSDWWAAVAIIGVVAALFAFLVPTIILPSRHVGRTTCRRFAEQTGYPTKFVILNWADTGTCLARTPDGHWTQNTNIIVNVPAR